MKKFTLGQKALKKLFEYPQSIWKQAPRLLVSTSYITNGYIIINKKVVKNFSALSTDGIFDVNKVKEIGKIEASPITDIQVEQAIGLTTEQNTTNFEKTGVVLIGEKEATLLVYRSDSTGLMFFDYKNIIEYLGLDIEIFHAASNASPAFDEIGKENFNVAVMPISVGGMNTMIEKYSKALKCLIHSLN